MTNLIVDPDDLNQNTEVVFDPAGTPKKTIQLIKAGNLGDEGVTLQCVYSFCKEEWKSDANLIKFPFPFIAITEEKFELVNGWDFKDATTRNLVRIGGWALKDAAGVSEEEYSGIVTLGVIGGADQAYYQQVAAAAPTNIVLTGVVNQAVKVYGDATHGAFDYRAYFKIFVREYAKTYGMSQLGDIGVTTMTYQVYRFPLANGTDLKIVATDANIIGNTPYFGTATLTGTDGSVTINSPTFTSTTGGFVAGDVGKYICIDTGANKGFYKIITWTSTTVVEVERNFGATEATIVFSVNPEGMIVTWYTEAQQRLIGATNYNFHVIVDGGIPPNQGTAEQIYTFVQYQLRQNNDIDAGAGNKIGKVTSALLNFIGDSLYTLLYTTGEGTYIDDHQEIDRTRLYFTDDTGAVLQFPYAAVLALQFGDNLKADAEAMFWAFFTNDDAGTNEGRDYGTATAILVDSTSAVATAHRARTDNVATIGTATAHGLAIGNGIKVSGVGGTGYNGNAIVLTVPDTTHFTYTNAGTNETEIVDTGGTITRTLVGKVSGASNVQFSFAYDTNLQRGTGSDGKDAPITVVGIGLSTAQFVVATGTILRSLANVVSLVAALERNYKNV